MITELMKLCCAGLFIYAVGFIFLETRVKFHKGFILFGLNILILCIFSGLDLWFKPMSSGNLALIKVQHIAFCFFPPTLLIQLSAFSGQFKKKYWPFCYLPSIVLTLLFSGNALMHPEKGHLVLTGAYNFIFIPYLVAAIIGIIWLCIYGIQKSNERRLFIYHLSAGFIMAFCGILDLFSLYFKKYLSQNLPSFSIIGTILFGFILLYIFTDRLILIIKQNHKLYSKLQDCYTDLEKARSLISTGKSPAIINHETRGYLFSIQFLLQKLKSSSANEANKGLFDKIAKNVNSLYRLNYDLINISKEKIISGNPGFDIVEMINGLSAEHPAAGINLTGFDQKQIIYGDKQRIRKALSVLFSFLISHSLTDINIKLVKDSYVILITIIAGRRESDRKPSDATRKIEFVPENELERLDISIVRYTVEGNGGNVSILKEESETSVEQGFVFYITFPNYAETIESVDKNKDNIVLVKEGIKNIGDIVRIFNNVLVNPHVVQSLEDFPYHMGSDIVIIGSREEIQPLISLDYKKRPRFYILSETQDRIEIIEESSQTADILSEYFVLGEILKMNREVPA